MLYCLPKLCPLMSDLHMVTYILHGQFSLTPSRTLFSMVPPYEIIAKGPFRFLVKIIHMLMQGMHVNIHVLTMLQKI